MTEPGTYARASLVLIPGPGLGPRTKKKALALLGLFSWLRDQDSNLGPHGYEPCELPLLHPAALIIGFLTGNVTWLYSTNRGR